MSSEPIALSVSHLSKNYLLYNKPSDRLKQMVLPKLRRAIGMPTKQYFGEFRALDDVSLSVRAGETVGIIGRNGSGKSTLLQLICGTLRPSEGTITVNGRIAALLELGAGFNTEFSGRENIYLNAMILGISREEINMRFDSIVRFAGIGTFIDQPVKTYSSGMYIRLAFAIAINVDPDILIIDEALSVGDEAFQRKCYARLEQIQKNGGTILFVSHSAGSILQLCNRAILMDQGECILQGDPKTVIHQYQRLINLKGEEAQRVRAEILAIHNNAARARDQDETTTAITAKLGDTILTDHAASPPQIQSDPPPIETTDLAWFDPSLVSDSQVEYEAKGAELCDVEISSLMGTQVNHIARGWRYKVRYTIDFKSDVQQCVFGMQVKTLQGQTLAGVNNAQTLDPKKQDFEAGTSLRVEIDFLCHFLPGTYSLDVGVFGEANGETRFAHRRLDALIFKVIDEPHLSGVGHFDLDGKMTFRHLSKSD